MLNACYGLGFLVLPGAVTAFVLLGSWSWIKGLCLALYATSAVYYFPRHYFAHTVTTSAEGFEYLPRDESRRKSVRWAGVTGYRWGFFWVRLLRVDDRVHFVFERALLIQDRRSFLVELKERCPTAKYLSLAEYLRFLWRGMKEAAADSRSLSIHQAEPAQDDESQAQHAEDPSVGETAVAQTGTTHDLEFSEAVQKVEDRGLVVIEAAQEKAQGQEQQERADVQHTGAFLPPAFRNESEKQERSDDDSGERASEEPARSQ